MMMSTNQLSNDIETYISSRLITIVRHQRCLFSLECNMSKKKKSIDSRVIELTLEDRYVSMSFVNRMASNSLPLFHVGDVEIGNDDQSSRERK